MAPSRILRRAALALVAVVVGAAAVTYVRARGRQPTPPDGSGWQQLS